MKLNLIVRSDGLLEAGDDATLEVLKMISAGSKLSCEAVDSDKRSGQQNKALHVFLGQLAQVLNDAGFTQMKVLKHDAEIEWTTATAKENLWKPLQHAMINRLSTTEANKADYSAVHFMLSKHLASTLGVTVPAWPSR